MAGMFHLIFALVVFFGVYVWLATEKAPRHLVVLSGAAALVLGQVLTVREAVRLINWNALCMLLGMFILVEAMSSYGLFDWLAVSLARGLRHRPISLFFVLCAAAGFISMIVNNITVMIVLTSLTLEICRYVPLEPVPLIVGEVCCANMLGAATLIGAPPNLVMATTLGIGFNRVALHMAPVVLIGTIVFMGVYYIRHRRLLAASGPDRTSPSLNRVHRSTSHRWQRLEFLLEVDFETLVFFMGLFILVGALDHVGIFHALALRLTMVHKPILLTLAVLWLSAVVSAFVDNLPMALAMAYLIKEMTLISPAFPSGILVWAALVGLTFGGNMTPIGASPNIVAYGILEKQKIRVGWKKWAALTVPATLSALLTATFLLGLKFRMEWY